MLTEVSKMAARNDAFVKHCFELLRKKSSYPLISEGRRICQLNLLTLGAETGALFVKQLRKLYNGEIQIGIVGRIDVGRIVDQLQGSGAGGIDQESRGQRHNVSQFLQGQRLRSGDRGSIGLSGQCGGGSGTGASSSGLRIHGVIY